MKAEDRRKLWQEWVEQDFPDGESYTRWLEEEIFKHRNRESEVKNDH